MSRKYLATTGLLVLLIVPVLMVGCSDDNPTEPLPPTKAVIVAPAAGDTLKADELVRLEGYGTMTTGQPVWPNRLAWYLGAGSDTTFIATGFTPTVALEAGTHTITLIAYESLSLSGTATVTFTVVDPDNWDPVATILEPLDGEDFLPAHVTTVLSGLATDVEEDLEDDDIVWTSDLQGTLGNGAYLETALMPGTHMLVLTATDSGAQTDADTISVVVRARPSAPMVDGDFFFRAADFTVLCPGKDISQLIGDCTIDVDEGSDTANMTIHEMAGSISCDTADVCFLEGELAQGNVRVTASGNHTGGGTVQLEFSLFVSAPGYVEGLVRAIETPDSGPECTYRSRVLFTLKSD